MATRAHSTPASASRRRPHQVTAAAQPEATIPRSADARQLVLPGAAALLRSLEILWRGHNAMEAEGLRLQGVGENVLSQALLASARYRSAQAGAMERVALAFSPDTPADAIAQLILVHSEVHSLVSSDGDHEEPVRALLETALHAVVVLAKAHDFDLKKLSGQYLTKAELMIVRGEVVT